MREAFGQCNLLTNEDSKLYYRSTGQSRPSITIPQFRARLTLLEAAALAQDLEAAVEAAEKVDTGSD